LCALALASAVSSAQVPFERIVNSDAEPGSWLTYSGNYAGHRFSALDEIDRENVGALRVAWVYQFTEGGRVETSPIVADGVMYFTEPPATVTALDIRSGRKLWSHTRTMPEKLTLIGFGPVNRGVALLDDTVYAGTLDCFLMALDRVTGAVRWETNVGDNATGHSITVAPLALDGKIIVGVSGGEAGIRGYLDAYDAKTSERVWRLYTIPGPGEPGHETWGGDSWKTGAGPTWVTGSYDPELDLLYWGVGNPGPDWNGDVRPGDNLHTCSLLAIDPKSGTLRWHFQFTPHDTHDWDANQVPVLIEGKVLDQPRKLVATANRNAFYYLLDRSTGTFYSGVPYAKQTWASGLTEEGRPIVLPDTEPTEEGTLVYPSLQGATNWFSPSYSPKTGLFYVPTREMGAYYFKNDSEYEPGAPFMGGGERALTDEAYGAIRALDALTGEQRWEFRLPSPSWTGVMSTAGSLVFGGSAEGNFYALDAETGKPLWDFQTGGPIVANPISFAIDGRQHVAIAAGHNLYVFGLPAE
jgi:alcohol dehydrogenase (cytochrome c)